MAGPSFEGGPPLGPLTLHTGMSADELATLLPPKARQRLETLTLRREDAHALIPEGETVRQLNAERFGAERHLQRLMAHASDGGNALAEDDIRVVVAKRNLDTLTAKTKATQQRYAQRNQEFQAIARVHTDVMAWIVGRPSGTALEDHDAPPPALLKNEDIPTAISRLQRRGRELTADLARIAAAPFPSPHVKQKMRQEIEALAARGTPSMALLVEHDREIAWPQINLQSAIFNAQSPSFGAVETTDTLALIAWLLRDQLIAALDREIDSEADDKSALTRTQREKQAATVQGDLLDIERQEATLMFRAWSEGLHILPRPDLAPMAVLNVVLITAPTISGSSPMRTAIEVVTGGRR